MRDVMFWMKPSGRFSKFKKGDQAFSRFFLAYSPMISTRLLSSWANQVYDGNVSVSCETRLPLYLKHVVHDGEYVLHRLIFRDVLEQAQEGFGALSPLILEQGGPLGAVRRQVLGDESVVIVSNHLWPKEIENVKTTDEKNVNQGMTGKVYNVSKTFFLTPASDKKELKN